VPVEGGVLKELILVEFDSKVLGKVFGKGDLGDGKVYLA
jgi:hypothetical protein